MKVSSTTSMHLRLVLAASLACSVAGFMDLIDSRIVGGDEAEPGDYPYFVDMWTCGGALIAPDIVLYAAHCGDTAKNMQLNIGAWKPKSPEGGSSQPRFCDEWIPDPEYAEDPVSTSDFALCKLDRPVDLHRNSTQKQVYLELNYNNILPVSGDELVVIGQGKTGENEDVSETLRDVMVPALSNAECNRWDRYQGLVSDRMFCAGYPDDGEKDSCQGDSGGPIVSRVTHADGTVTDTHMGVVSWGAGCARERYPGVYARTSSRYQWIKDTMCNTLNSVSDLCHEDSGDINDDWKEEAANDGPTQCEGTDQAFHLKLRTDKYATETGWLLSEDHSGEWIKMRKYLINEYDNDFYMCLKANTCYNWEIRDSYGDGMCAQNVCGNYELDLQGETIHTGDGTFGSVESFTFCTTDKTLPPVQNSDSIDSLESLDESVDVPPPVVVTQPPQQPITEVTDPPQQPITVVTSPPVPTDPPVTAAPTSVCGADNFDLEFSLQVQTDDSMGEISIVMYSILPDFSDLNELVLVDEKLGTNSYYTFPGDDNDNEPICLQDNTCYIFAVTDLDSTIAGSGGESDGYYNAYLGGVEVFEGDYSFSKYDDRMFCTGNAFIPSELDIDVTADPTSSPTTSPTTGPTEAPTTDFPTQVPTTGLPTQPPTSTDMPSSSPTASTAPTALPTVAPTRSPTEVPTASPTASPTAAPTASPTATPTSSPTAAPTSSPTDSPTSQPTSGPTSSPTANPTEAPVTPTDAPVVVTAAPTSHPTSAPTVAPTDGVVCEDDPNYRFKKKKKWTCAVYLKGKNTRRLKKKCNKKWRGKRVHESCPHTCGKKVGVGKCAFLGKKRRRRGKKTATSNQMVKLGAAKDDEEQHNIFAFSASSTMEAKPANAPIDENWLNFKNRMTAETTTTTTKSGSSRKLITKISSSNKFRKLILDEMKRN